MKNTLDAICERLDHELDHELAGMDTIFWFTLLERSVNQGDTVRAERAKRELHNRGVDVVFLHQDTASTHTITVKDNSGKIVCELKSDSVTLEYDDDTEDNYQRGRRGSLTFTSPIFIENVT